jgi:hypothetical protein
MAGPARSTSVAVWEAQDLEVALEDLRVVALEDPTALALEELTVLALEDLRVLASEDPRVLGCTLTARGSRVFLLV